MRSVLLSFMYILTFFRKDLNFEFQSFEFALPLSEAYSEPGQASKIVVIAEILSLFNRD